MKLSEIWQKQRIDFGGVVVLVCFVAIAGYSLFSQSAKVTEQKTEQVGNTASSSVATITSSINPAGSVSGTKPITNTTVEKKKLSSILGGALKNNANVSVYSVPISCSNIIIDSKVQSSSPVSFVNGSTGTYLVTEDRAMSKIYTMHVVLVNKGAECLVVGIPNTLTVCSVLGTEYDKKRCEEENAASPAIAKDKVMRAAQDNITRSL